MKVVQINSVCGVGSTGGITVEISRTLTENNIENYILYTIKKHTYPLGIKYSNLFYVKINALMARVFGNYGFNSYLATKKLIHYLDEIKPDIIHLHNMHGHDLNLEQFFRYLKKIDIPVIWTLHDCWPFTGYCMHFDALKCNKWQTKCSNCPQKHKFSFFFDRSETLYKKKKELITSLSDMTIVSPSIWLAQLATHSFLNKYPVEIINNGIDLHVFKKVESNFKEKYSIGDRRIILGVPKGKLRYFIELAGLVEDDYILVLVGLTESELRSLPNGVLGIPYVSREVMAEIFSAADVYVNTTLEDTFPTVNIEALACGTPVITFNTGGSPECIDDDTGIVVEKHNVPAIYEAVKSICNGEDKSDACIKRAKSLYDAKERFGDYLDLYNRVWRNK